MKLLLALPFALFIDSEAFSQEREDSIRRIKAEPIVVSSTRIPEKKIDVPMGVSAIEQTQYQDSRSYELKDALSLVPGVFSQSRSGTVDDRITIRGFGARGAGDRSNAGNLRGIRVMIDGIPETEPDGRTSLDNIDLPTYSHLEVLRSNASTLYGSAAGGVISLYTNTDFTDPFVTESFRSGSYGFMKNTMMAGAVSGASHIFTSFSNASYDGYRAHSQSQSGNAKIVVQSKIGESTGLLVNATAASNIFRFPGPLTFAEFQADPLQANATYVKQDEHRFNRVGRFGLTLDQDLGSGHSASGTVYAQPKRLTRSERNTWREFNRYSIGSSGKYSWFKDINETTSNTVLAGFDQQFQDGTIQFFNLDSNQARGTTLDQNKSEAASNVGFYVQDEFVIDDLRIVAGGRFDLLKYNFEDFTGADPKDEAEFSEFTPKVALSYKLGASSSIYAAFGGGLEAPAFNEVDPPSDSIIIARGGTPGGVFNPFLKPAKSTTIEIGTKGLLTMDGTLSGLSYDVAVFMITVEDDIIPWNGGRYYFMAGKTSRTGAELGFAAYFDFNLTARGAFTFMDAKYNEYENLLGKFDGNKQAGIPSLLGRFSLQYDFDFGLYAQAGLNHVGEYYADDRNDKNPDGTPDASTNSLAPAYTIFDVSVGYQRRLFDVLDLKIFASMNNITDEQYVSSVFINGASNRYFESGMPSNFSGGLSLSYLFSK
jgi:iron complex outermembrane receptor protein